jgi:hypothetical protein
MAIISPILLIMLILEPVGMVENSIAIDVSDGSLEDWDYAPVKLYDDQGETNVAQTDLAYVSFDYDETWLYVRWDIYDNLSYSPQVLYDMGINLTGNLTGSDSDWDIYVSAETDRIGGIPVLVNISIRDSSDNHVWNASDDGNMSEDGSLYFDPTPGLPPGNLSVEARFPLAYLRILTGVIFGQFRSHPSTSVESVVKDRVPDSGYIILIIDYNPPQLTNLTATPDPQENGNPVNITVNATDNFGIGSIWVNITHPDGSWTNVSMINGSTDEWYLEDIYDDPGVYTYKVWTNDTSNNWDTLGPQTFTIVDTDGPLISNIQATPDPQENGRDVNVTVDVTDDVAVDSVWINITYPDGSSSNVTMMKGLNDQWYHTAPFDDLGVYSYTIWASDTSINWETAAPGTFTIQDTDGPFFDNLIDSPDPQENGDFVNVSVDVTDDFAVDSVSIEIIYPDLSTTNITMEKGSGDQWFYTTTFDDLGTYNYTIWAHDSNGNWNLTVGETFAIQDTDGPFFDNLVDSPDPQENGEFVNISLDVIDDFAVDSVSIEITFPDLSSTNFTMEKGSGDQWFYTTTYGDLGTYTYIIWANDTNGNWNSTVETFIIHDTESPEFSDPIVTPNPQEMDGNVNISVDIFDDIGIDEVWIEIRYPNGTWVNRSMVPGSDDEHFLDIPYHDLGSYAYAIFAVDTSGNWNSTGLESFVIVDTESPIIGTPIVTPNPQDPGEDINVTVNVTDDGGISQVQINITFPNGTSIIETMEKGPDDTWYYNGTFLSSGNFTYTISAEDISGNSQTSDSQTFTILPGESPEPPPEKKPRKLYIALILIFWPLLLIIFTTALERRYGFGNRAKKDMERVTSAMINDPDIGLSNSFKGNIRNLMVMCQKAGIPPEEFIYTALTIEVPMEIQTHNLNRMLSEINNIYER